MSRVVLAGADEDLILRVKQAADGDVAVLPPGRLPGDPARLFEQLVDGELPDVLLVGPHAPAPEVLTLAARLDVQSPGIAVVLMAEPVAARCGRPPCGRASGTCSHPAADVDEIRAAVERAAQAAAGRRRVLRPAGGDRALHRPGHHHRLAQGRGRQDHGVDQPGRRADRARAAVDRAGRPRRAVRRRAPRRWAWCRSTRCPTPSAARPARTRWSSRPSSPSTRAGCTPSAGRSRRPPATPSRGEDVTRLLASLAREFRYVVVDTAPGLSEQTLAALDRATDVVMLTSMDVPGVRGLRKELDVLRELCHDPGRPARGHELRRPQGRAVGARRRDRRSAPAWTSSCRAPRHVPASTNQGVPMLAERHRRDPMAKELQRLVSRFAATPLMKPGRYRAKHRAAD